MRAWLPVRWLAVLWALPATLLGLAAALLAVLTGGRAQVVDGVVEAHGGLVTWLLAGRLPVVGNSAAMTLGHVVIGQDERLLAATRRHERVHVRQYERWGPLFIPAYLAASLLVALRGGHPYLDNPFERQAYREEHGSAA